MAEHRGGTHYARERPQPQPPHTRGTFHRRLQPLHTEKYKVSCSGFPPKQSPCNIHAAITIRFAASCSKPASLYAHGNTGLQQSCSLSNAICNHRFKKRIELRTQEQPLVAEHRGGTHYARNDRSRNRRTHELPFIAGCSHFTRKNTRFRAPASSPKQSPCNMHAAITIRFAASRRKPASLYAHGNTRWQQSCSLSNSDLQPQIQEKNRSTHTGTTTRGRTQRRNPLRPERPQPQPPHTQGIPFIAGCSHFTRKNTRFRSPASSPKQSPMQHSCGHYNTIRSIP